MKGDNELNRIVLETGDPRPLKPKPFPISDRFLSFPSFPLSLDRSPYLEHIKYKNT